MASEHAGMPENFAPLGAATNYGVQVSYNAGTISNYFCFDPDVAHRCDLPGLVIPREESKRHTYQKVERARRRFQSGRWDEAKTLFYETLEPNELHRLSQADRILTQYNLGHAHFALAEFNDAARHFKTLLQAHEDIAEETEKSVNDSRYWLARCHFHSGRFEDAANELQIFVLTFDQAGFPPSEQMTNGRLWLGLSFEGLKDYQRARVQLQVAYESSAKDGGEQNLGTLTCRHHLANFLYKRQDFLGALEHFDALLETEEELKGPERAAANQTRCMLAFTLAKLGRMTAAEQHLQRAASWMNAARRTGHGPRPEELRDAGLVHHLLGRIAARRRDLETADTLLRKATDYLGKHREKARLSPRVQDDEQELKDNMTESRRLLAEIMIAWRQYPAAENAFREMLSELQSDRNEHRMACIRGLARSLRSQAKDEEVQSTLQEVSSTAQVITYSDQLATNDENYLYDCVYLLGCSLRSLGRELESQSCFERLVRAVPDKPNIQHDRARVELAMACFRSAAYPESEELSRSALESMAQYLKSGPIVDSDRTTAMALFSWSQCELGRLEEAEHTLRQSYATYTKKSENWSRSSGYHLHKVVTQYYIGRVLMHRMEFTNALKALHEAELMFDKSPNTPFCQPFFGHRFLCRYYKGYCSWRLGGSEARHIFEDILQSSTQDDEMSRRGIVAAHYWLGLILSNQKRHEEATKHFAACSEALQNESHLPLHQDVPRPRVLMWHANSLYNSGLHGHGQAIDIAQEILPNVAGDERLTSWARRILGACLWWSNRFEEACGHLQASLLAQQEAGSCSPREIILTRTRVADTLCELSRIDEAMPLLRELVEHDGDPRSAKAVASYWLGRHAFSRGELKEAAKRFDLAKTTLPTSPDFWSRIRLDCRHFPARILFREKKYAEASAQFLQLATQQYASGHVRHATDNEYWLGRSLQEEKRHAAARISFTKILETHAEGRLVRYAALRVRYDLARTLSSMEEHEAARIHFAAVIEVTGSCRTEPPLPSMAAMQSNLALCSFQQGQFQEALDTFQPYIVDSTPTCLASTLSAAGAGYYVGRTYLALNRFEDAIPFLQRAWDANQSATNYVYFLAEAQLLAARHKDAAANFRKSVEFYQRRDLSFPKKNPEAMERYLRSHHCIGLARFGLQDYEDALKSLQTALSETLKWAPKNQVAIMKIKFDIGRCQARLKRRKIARQGLVDLITFFEKTSSEGDDTIVHIRLEIANLDARAKLWKQAAKYYNEAMAHYDSRRGKSELDVLSYQTEYIHLLMRSPQMFSKVKSVAGFILEERRARDKPVTPSHMEIQLYLCQSLCYLAEFSKVESLAREALDWREQLGAKGRKRNVKWPLRLTLARSLYHRSDFSAAEKLYTEALGEIKPGKTPPWTEPVATVHAMLAMVLLKLGRHLEAQERAAEALKCECPKGWPDYQELAGFLKEFGPGDLTT